MRKQRSQCYCFVYLIKQCLVSIEPFKTFVDMRLFTMHNRHDCRKEIRFFFRRTQKRAHISKSTKKKQKKREKTRFCGGLYENEEFNKVWFTAKKKVVILIAFDFSLSGFAWCHSPCTDQRIYWWIARFLKIPTPSTRSFVGCFLYNCCC